MSARIPIYNGARYGRLVVIRTASRLRGHRRYRCECECGRQVTVRRDNLADGSTRSCGCLEAESRGKSSVTHGLSKHPLYKVWQGMRNRCYNERQPHYPRYGGRGIRVCARWLGPDGFPNFLADMGERPDGLSLDRIDNDGDYEPGNVRWATASQQALNRRPKATL